MPKEFDWKLWPETQTRIDTWLASALGGNAFAARLSERMRAETSTCFADWVDHIVVFQRKGLPENLVRLGYAPTSIFYAVGALVYAHEGGRFPRIVLITGSGSGSCSEPEVEVVEVAIKVESIAAFSRAHDLGFEPVGYPIGPYRLAKIPGARTGLTMIERRGYLGFEPFPGDLGREGRMKPHAARDAMAAFELWLGRRRRFDDDAEGFDVTETTLDRVIELCGSSDLACHLVFEAERDYWQSRNHAARVQKGRQDRLGLGWANHDHHTFRCSRRFFPRVIGLFKKLGFSLRERFQGGENAGWGAQILEHSTTGVVIFADLDLASDEASADFAHLPLPELSRPSTVGLWVGLHGESILEGGMHHLEAQFDFDALRLALKTEENVDVMTPFSDFPFLRQAFTAGERWSVSKHRADRLLDLGWIDAGQHLKFLTEGAIGSHLENLQRRDGYKGFNQQSVSAILTATDPRLH